MRPKRAARKPARQHTTAIRRERPASTSTPAAFTWWSIPHAMRDRSGRFRRLRRIILPGDVRLRTAGSPEPLHTADRERP
jgi:hypothetical protein